MLDPRPQEILPSQSMQQHGGPVGDPLTTSSRPQLLQYFREHKWNHSSLTKSTPSPALQRSPELLPESQAPLGNHLSLKELNFVHQGMLDAFQCLSGLALTALNVNLFAELRDGVVGGMAAVSLHERRWYF